MVNNTGYIRKENLLFSSRLKKAICTILSKNLKIRKSESLLIVHDKNHARLAMKFRSAAGFLNKVDLLEIQTTKVHGAEPKETYRKEFLKYDAIIILTDKSFSHTKARRDATKKGIRIASMPGITENILRRSIDIDYTSLKKDVKKIAGKLDRAKEVTIRSKLGTDITFSVKGRKAHGLSAGIYDKKGRWGNLPEGEVFIAPVEGTAEGHFVIDGSVAEIGKIKHPVIVFVKDGFVDHITNGKTPSAIEKMLDKAGHDARNIAEFGIGLNKKARVTGVVLEDEKAYGTCHIAFGNNIGFGGRTDVPIHIDCVFKNPDIFLDGKLIMKKGKLI